MTPARQPRVDALIFDLDGTLTDNLEADCNAFIMAFADFGHPGLTQGHIVAMFGPSSEGIVQGVVGNDWQECWQAYQRHYTEELTWLKPAPGIIDLLDWAQSAGLRLGLVTGASKSLAIQTIQALDLTHFGSKAKYGSPDGSIKLQSIKEMVNEWGLQPARVAYVGDAPRDMQIAKDAGVTGLGAAWASTADPAALQAAGASAVFKAPDGLRAWVLPG